MSTSHGQPDAPGPARKASGQFVFAPFRSD